MRRSLLIVVPILLVLPPSQLTTQVGGHSTQSTRAGYIAHIDTLTGDFLEEPFELPLDELDEQTLTGLMTNDDGLVEEVDAGGGTMVRLNGRFRSVYVGTVDPGGNVDASCLSGTTNGQDPK